MPREKVIEGKHYKVDAKGSLIPVELVKEIDQLRDESVYAIAKQAERMSEMMQKFKDEIFRLADEFVDLSAKKFKVKLGGKKGNVTLLSFDGEFKVLIASEETITFDERLQVAKELIDKCIKKWSNGAAQELSILVKDAFKVDKQGNLDTKQILGLKRYEITDRDWKKAMEAIAESVQVASTKRYIRVYRKVGEDKFEQIPLDISKM